MANTWQGRMARWLPPSFNPSVLEDPGYNFKRTKDSLTYTLDGGASGSLSLPVDISMGGRRHGLGFLVLLKDVSGIQLDRPVLVQTRYAWSPEKNSLLLAPGCDVKKSQSLESALGLVLSPTFESRCLSCHGEPNLSGSGKTGGVHCEACHGPGSAHLAAIAKGKPAQGIMNPKRLSVEESMAVCARCHVGLTKFSDPAPSDLLIANQVRAIQTSECFIQSGKAFSCTACHDPHNDAADDKQAVETCLGCHSIKVPKHAAICPVNQAAGCVGCHMPSVDQGPLHLVDHVIRVHPEQTGGLPSKHGPELRSRVQPISEFLRVISTNSFAGATAARRRIDSGEPFYQVARELSADHSSDIGGYLGRKAVSELPKDLRDDISRLGYGELSNVLQSNGKWFVFRRLPRDFRGQAAELQNVAESLAANGDVASAINKTQAALIIYPPFLRALHFLGVTFSQNGNPKKGADILAVATRVYPEDASLEFALAASLSLQGDTADAMAAYKRVISLETDFTAAYVNLGMLCYSAKEYADAIRVLRQGLQIDPLNAELSYDLGLALTAGGDPGAGSKAIDLARKLDEGLVSRREAER